MNRNWKKYNQLLVSRGEIMLSFDAIDSWSTELKEMNHKKEGHKFVYPKSFMEALGYYHDCNAIESEMISKNVIHYL